MAKFTFFEVVLLVKTDDNRFKELVNHEGIVVGKNEPDDQGKCDYAVHFNELGENIVLPEENLRSCGQIADRKEIITRSRIHKEKR